MGPRIETVDRTTMASPLSQDFLSFLSGQMGNIGTGVGPLQRAGGAASLDFTNRALGNTLVRDVPSLEQFRQLLLPGHQIGVSEGVADLREGFGAQGRRFGTSLAVGEGRLRAGAQAGLDQALASIGTQLTGLGVQRDLSQAGLGLQGAGQAAQIGAQSLMPFMQMAQLGILPPEVIAQPNPWLQLGTAAIQGGGTVLGGRLG